ncbi:uncharacterized protein LOC129904155 isoform X1 [Solanum dulcamara]|uniref:uncharacterized protein LOC129904155 isoform X1 n=1 Tax=Solanum dulcamara TaxID=45834 RepID=UPI002486BAAF|nr:uncharacterized protein LOC129904155 isoform X1 [Solanum dulcamara]
MTELKEVEHLSMKQVYLKLRGDFQKVEWRSLVCKNLGSPRWIFTLRLASYKLYTRDRFLKWAMVVDPSCPLCTMADEIHSHLFFACSVSAHVWQKLLNWFVKSRVPGEWDFELPWATTYAKYKSSRAEVYRMLLAAAIYHLWRERNRGEFRGSQACTC